MLYPNAQTRFCLIVLMVALERAGKPDTLIAELIRVWPADVNSPGMLGARYCVNLTPTLESGDDISAAWF